MLDAYFSPPVLEAADTAQMANFGIDACLLALQTAHAEPQAPDEGGADRSAGDVLGAIEHPSSRQDQAAAYLREAGISVAIADAISPHREPDRHWAAQWEALASRAFLGEIQALGCLVVHQGSHRALEILDRHLDLAETTNIPVLVEAPRNLNAPWKDELHRRAKQYASLWYWVHPPINEAIAALCRGEGAIVTPGRTMSADVIMDIARSLPPEALTRLAVGSSRGRGLNPFALAACEIAFDEGGGVQSGRSVLDGGALRRALWSTDGSPTVSEVGSECCEGS